jgi:hypothetical protein
LYGYLCVYGVAVVDYVDSLVGGVGLAGGVGEAQAVVMRLMLWVDEVFGKTVLMMVRLERALPVAV